MKLTNKLGLPQPIFDAVANDPYSKGDADYSVTGLLRPPRIAELQRQHYSELSEDCADRLYSLFGQITHGILERSERVAIPEQRLSVSIKVDDEWIKVSGAMDRFLVIDGLLQDYKLTSIWKVSDGVPIEWTQQQNVYVYLLRRNGYAVHRAEVVGLFRDWHKGSALRDPEYPPLPAVVLNIPLWEDAQTLSFIEERIRMHRAASHTLPECNADDRWASPESFGVYRAGGKRSVASYGTKEEAQDHVRVFTDKMPSKDKRPYEVRHKKSENKRCAGWCNVSDHCEQWKALRQL